jgi:hypothetical protein
MNDIDAVPGVDAGSSVCIFWNSVELDDLTDLVIARKTDTEMVKIFGIPVDDRDKEEADEANLADDGESAYIPHVWFW